MADESVPIPETTVGQHIEALIADLKASIAEREAKFGAELQADKNKLQDLEYLQHTNAGLLSWARSEFHKIFG